MKLKSGAEQHQLTKEDQRKGGATQSQQKKYAALITQSHKSLCKNCPARCLIKQKNLEQAKNHRCVVPEARAKAIWFKMPVMSEEILDKLDSEALMKLGQECTTTKDFKMLHDAIINKKRTDYPKVAEMKIDQRVAIFDFNKMKELYDEVNK